MPLFALFPLAVAVALDGAPALEDPSARSQLLVVVTPSWTADAGRAVLVEGDRVTFGPAPVRVGRGGLGWGLGEHVRPPGADGPTKREGDGRAPAGRFRIGPRWERADAHDAWCVDDVASPLYTRIVRLPPGDEPTWSSAEHMMDYRVAVVVEHNPDARPSGGSCIFLHDGVDPTAGCTAFVPGELDALIALLRPDAEIIQLPESTYRDLAPGWGLPALDRIGLDPLEPADDASDPPPTEDPAP